MAVSNLNYGVSSDLGPMTSRFEGSTEESMSRILIIDDEPQIANMLRSLFDSNGFEVDVAHDGNAGLRAFRTTPADVVITDILMPEKEGLETIAELREDYPDVKIIAMSGGTMAGVEGYLKLAEMRGAGRVFKKPFKLTDILQAVNDLIDS